jgi:hypothetical protein
MLFTTCPLTVRFCWESSPVWLTPAAAGNNSARRRGKREIAPMNLMRVYGVHCSKIHYSTRNASMGSSLAARAPGSQTASRATADKMTGTVTYTMGSQDLTPKRKLAH